MRFHKVHTVSQWSTIYASIEWMFLGLIPQMPLNFFFAILNMPLLVNMQAPHVIKTLMTYMGLLKIAMTSFLYFYNSSCLILL
jgi:hypothetical protein